MRKMTAKGTFVAGLLLLILSLPCCGGAGRETFMDMVGLPDTIEDSVVPAEIEDANPVDGRSDFVPFPDTGDANCCLPDQDGGDTEEDSSSFPEPGEAGYPCKQGKECLSGFCIQTPDGMQCTVPCEEECPFDWKCVLHTPSLPDQVWLCIPPHMDLCRPCTSNQDCWTGGIDSGARCVPYGDSGSFCGAACVANDPDMACPGGYQCQKLADVTGTTIWQCALAEEECSCPKWFIDQGATTNCKVSNEWGSCAGTRMCTTEGLSACNAQEPAAEVCNLLDDDCDGEVDEGTSGQNCSITNVDGTCPGVEDCKGGVLSCIGPEPKPETCNGIDDNCDGNIDENWPDTDGDGLADCVDEDLDGDGVANALDNCPAMPNGNQADWDGDKLGDLCDPDADGDAIPDAVDNCLFLQNSMQTDTDKDGIGDPCDSDLDGDKVDNEADNCLYIPNPLQEDLDGDGVGDACEDDLDGDGVIDSLDCAPANPAIFPGAEEVCDGVDNDCDFQVDEGFPDFDADGIKNCVDLDDDDDLDPDDSDCAPLDPKVHKGAKEVCNGIDDDCNGETDDGLGNITCGKGLCFHAVPACVEGKPGFCDPYDGAKEEICDGLDNDCDGLTDEDLGWSICGKGVCQHTLYPCKDGLPAICNPLEGASPEICDGLDNDCDGLVDNGLGTTTCGQGPCKHSEPACVDGKPQQCNPFLGSKPEVCDGQDNDCDGQVDEELGSTTCGKGVCLHTIENCVEGKPQICNPMEGAGAEVCDLQDNDCDGKVDEDLAPQTCGLGICQHTVPGCIDGNVPVCDPFEGAAEETCNGKDDDCDGQIDEGLPSQTCGLGVCKHTIPGCIDGKVPVCNPMEGADKEICDGKDNDCNGEVDEGLGTLVCGLGECLHEVPACKDGKTVVCDPFEGATPESCNGKDDDCDGEIDEVNAIGCTNWYQDLDGDGFGAGPPVCLCAPTQSHNSMSGDDCDDLEILAFPGGVEVCYNQIDEDCSGEADDGCPLGSCKAIMQAGKSVGNGIYQIDPDAAGPIQPFDAYCNMTTDQGGWTLVAKVNGSDSHNLLYDVWTTKNTVGNISDFSLTSGSDVLYQTYAMVAGSELLFYDATALCGNDNRLAQTGSHMGNKTLKQFLTDLPPYDCAYYTCQPPDGPNAPVAVFRNTGCTNPFNPSWGSNPVNMFSNNKIGINIAMYKNVHFMRFTNTPNDFDAGIGSKGSADGGYNCGDMDSLVDNHNGWPGHIATIYVR